MEYMSNPLIAGAVGALIAAIAKMVDDKMNKKEMNTKQYIKCGLFVFVLVAIIVYMATSNETNMIGGAEEILTDPF